MRRLPLLLSVLGVTLLIAAGALFVLRSSDFLITPDKAKPLAGRVTVQGEKPSGPGGIYYVDVLVRRASLLERLLAPLRPEGAELLPERAPVAPGQSDADRRRQSLRQMDRSEEIAAAVALKQLGYDVKASADGVIVDAVRSDVPANGLLQPSDVIVSAQGKRVRTPSDLRRIVGPLKPGTVVTIGVRNGAATKTLRIRTVPDPAGSKRALLGVAVSQSAEIKLPVKVNIDLGQVGGPSAGLPFALDVLQELGTNVDQGRKVVATGEIALDGSVGPIGGVKQKTYGARKAGADVFLVPAGENAAEARRYAGNLLIIPVVSFQQALSALRTLPAK